jgi:hypothetical protein
MTVTITWKIANLEREIADGFVYTGHYTVSAESDQLKPDGTPYTSGAYGSVGFQRPGDLIPFADLTEDQVVNWVKEALGGDEKVAEIEAQLEARLAELISPSKINGVPW